MEFKHFSHTHVLVFHQMSKDGSKIKCLGCKSPGLGNAYVCWDCNYFFHEQCFRASRSLTHPSHSLHQLTLMPSPTYTSGAFLCSHCNLEGNGFSYSCSQCEFDLHVHCAHDMPNQTHNSTTPINVANLSIQNNPGPISSTTTKHFSHPHAMKAIKIEQNNAKLCSACDTNISGPAYSCTEPNCTFNLHKTCFESPTEILHKSHHQHPLTLLPAPSYSDGFKCDACQKHGNAFVYNCATCTYDLHINCAKLPEIVTRPDHNHNLILYYSSPRGDNVTFMCDVCNDKIDNTAWAYHCRECAFRTHLECVASEVKQVSVSDYARREEELLKMQNDIRLFLLR